MGMRAYFLYMAKFRAKVSNFWRAEMVEFRKTQRNSSIRVITFDGIVLYDGIVALGL